MVKFVLRLAQEDGALGRECVDYTQESKHEPQSVHSLTGRAYGTQCKKKGTDIPAKHGYMAKWCIKMHYDALTFYGKKQKHKLKQVLLHRYTLESKLCCVLQRTSKSV